MQTIDTPRYFGIPGAGGVLGVGRGGAAVHVRHGARARGAACRDRAVGVQRR